MLKKLYLLIVLVNVALVYLVLMSYTKVALILIIINLCITLFFMNVISKNIKCNDFEILFKEEQTHFVFNAFNTIAYYCRIDSEIARRLVVELSNYMRGAFCSNVKKVDISEELMMLQSYLYIQSVRFEKSFDFERNIKCKDLFIPRFLLINLVQLGFSYGVLKQKGAKALLEVIKCDEKINIALTYDNIYFDDIKTSTLNDNLIVSLKKVLSSEYGSTLFIEKQGSNSIKLWFQL